MYQTKNQASYTHDLIPHGGFDMGTISLLGRWGSQGSKGVSKSAQVYTVVVGEPVFSSRTV